MALTIEQAQKLSEMRVRILKNTQAGKEPHDGFTQEEITEALGMLRKGREASGEAAAAKAAAKGKGKGGKKKKAATPAPDAGTFFGGIDLDEDEEEVGGEEDGVVKLPGAGLQ